jgi:hypothetical protein
MQAAAKNLRTAERFLLAPPLPAEFSSAAVAICDISARGARFKHQKPLETGRKGVLKVSMEGRPKPVSVEAVVVWSHSDSGSPGQYLSGVRTYGSQDAMDSLLAQLQNSKRSNRIEELRSADRFLVIRSVDATFGGEPVMLENLSAHGTRIETLEQPRLGEEQKLSFRVPQSELQVDVGAVAKWSVLKAIGGGDVRTYRVGLQISSRPELLRLAIGLLSESGRATLDTQSLVLKLKILRARARQFAPAHKSIEASGVPAEQYLLIQGVREELRHNADEAMHWYRRARLVINDPKSRSEATIIADHPDALAVWEYLDRSVDPSMIGRAFNLVH